MIGNAWIHIKSKTTIGLFIYEETDERINFISKERSIKKIFDKDLDKVLSEP